MSLVGCAEQPAVYALDDDPLILETIAAALRRAGRTCRPFRSAERFVQATLDSPPAFALIDLCLPGSSDGDDRDGIEVLRELAAHRCEAKILLMSGMEGRVLRSAEQIGRELGLTMVGVVRKPFQPSSVVSLIEASGGEHIPRGPKSALQELHRAVRSREFVLAYQPQVSFESQAIIGCEALIRWQHPERGLLFPAAFLDLAHTSGLINPITDWVLATAIGQVAEWQQAGLESRVSVNIPASYLHNLNLPDRISAMLAEAGVPGTALTLELTESAAMEDMLSASDILTRLRLKGIGLSIDDFGTGHSSLVKLRRMPFSEIKIDRSFVSDLCGDSDSEVITRTIIAMAGSLGMKTIAEGVEDFSTWCALDGLGCDHAQGFLVAKALPPKDFRVLCERQLDLPARQFERIRA